MHSAEHAKLDNKVVTAWTATAISGTSQEAEAWGEFFNIELEILLTKKLGIKYKTISIDISNTQTTVIQIKPECRVLDYQCSPCTLLGCRIIEFDSKDITKMTEPEVIKLMKKVINLPNKKSVLMKVCSPFRKLINKGLSSTSDVISTALSHPMNIIWGTPKTVRIRKNLDFKYKIKGSKSNKTMQYTLVREAPSDCPLKVGQLILSVDQEPVDSDPEKAKKIYEIISTSPNKEIQLIVQEPMCILQQSRSAFFDEQLHSLETLSSTDTRISSMSLDSADSVTLPMTIAHQEKLEYTKESTSQLDNGSDKEGFLRADGKTEGIVHRMKHRRNHSYPTIVKSSQNKMKRRQSTLSGDNEKAKLTVWRRKTAIDLSSNEAATDCSTKTGQHLGLSLSPTCLPQQESLSCSHCTCGKALLASNLRQLIHTSIKKIATENLTKVPKIKVMVVGSQSDSVAPLLASPVCKQPQHACSWYSQYSLALDDKLFPYPVSHIDKHEAGVVLRQVAEEMKRCSAFVRDLDLNKKQLLQCEDTVCGISCKDIGHALDSPTHRVNERMIHVDIMALENIPGKHIFYTKHSLFVITFDIQYFLKNKEACMRNIKQEASQIVLYAGQDCPISIIGVSKTTQQTCDILQINSMLQDTLVPFYDGQLIYNEATNHPLFVIDSLNSSSVAILKKKIHQMVVDQKFISVRYSMAGPICRGLLTYRDRQKTRCLTMNGLRRDVVEEMMGPVSDHLMDDILQYLHNSGEIICEKFLPICTCSSTNKTLMEMFVLMDPVFLISCLEQLTSVPPKSEQAPASRLFWNQLSHTKTFCIDHMKGMEPKYCLDAVEVAFMELTNLVLTHKSTCLDDNDEIQRKYRWYMIPSLLSPSKPIEKSSFTDSLYIDCHGFMPSTVFMYVMQQFGHHCIDNQGHMVIESCTSGSFSLNNVDFVLVLDEFTSIIKVCLPKRINCCDALKAINNIANCLPPRPKINYHIGPKCPLGDGCHVINVNQSKPHILNVMQSSVFCGSESLTFHPHVQMWVARNGMKVKQENVTDQTLLTALPIGLYTVICQSLNITSATGRDWKGLAAVIGKQYKDMELYALQQDPCQKLLYDWCTANKATLGDLKEALASPDLDRKDILQDIQQWSDAI